MHVCMDVCMRECVHMYMHAHVHNVNATQHTQGTRFAQTYASLKKSAIERCFYMNVGLF